MCGIAGCYGSSDKKTIQKMLDTLPHRGPDDRGIHSSGKVVLGHTRLSIIDVLKGKQPILTKDKCKGIICNGEIYNYLELKNKLENDIFLTDSDTEVILHLYNKYGLDAIKMLDGMFSFAIMSEDKLILARDPVGIKPLYYGYKNDTMYFSSELGAMSQSGVNTVKEFPAGHYYTSDTGFVQYYDIPENKINIYTSEEAIPLVKNAVIKSVHKRLLADKSIAVGSFCSGGLDSSLVAAIAAKEIKNIHTFAVGMKDKSGKESEDIIAARLVADHIGSTHHELIFTEKDYYDALPIVINKLESYDPSLVRCAVPCYFTCKLAANHVTVVLTGEGADEVFAGYHYMKNFPKGKINEEARRCLQNLHNINLQRADRMGMLFSLELRVPFLDTSLIQLGSHISEELKIKTENDKCIEKWILRKAFENTGLLPDSVLWRYKVQYTKGAGCEKLGEILAEKQIANSEYNKIKNENPHAVINSKEAALYYKIFRSYHPQDSILSSIGIWTGFDFPEEK
jgi:asparagine synthase (glutamine-hydrolysing)